MTKRINETEKTIEFKKDHGTKLMKKLVLSLKQKVRSNVTPSAMQ